MVNERISRFYGPLLLYIVGLNILVVSSAALLHELGHAGLGHWLGCGNIQIVLFSSDVQSTFAQMACTTGTAPSPSLLWLSGFFFLLPLAGMFFVLHPFKERFLGHIVFGVSIMVSATDIHLFTASRTVAILVLLTGAVIALYGEERLVNGIIVTELVETPDYTAREA